MTDDKKLIERLRAEADLDSRAGEPLGKRMREAAARLEALTTQQGEVVVKPLEWDQVANSPDLWVAGFYRIDDQGLNWKSDRYWLVFNGVVVGKFSALEEAKAAAQIHRERDILSAIEITHPAPDRGELVEALEFAVQQLDAVEKWARERCPCKDEQPSPCPLCGARAEDPNGVCKAGTALPYPLAGRVRQSVTSGRAVFTKHGGDRG